MESMNLRKSQDGVDELEEAFLAVGSVGEPGGVEEEGEGGLALGVVLQEVLGEDLLDGVNILVVEASVSHGAGSSSHILECLHGHLPHTRMGLPRTGLNTAAVGHLVLQGV